MTTIQALQIFDVLQDQYGAPYFPTDWKLKLFNMAQLETLNKMVPDSLGGVINFEFDANTYRNILPLIYTAYNMNMDASGILPYSTIETSMTGIYGYTTTIFAIISIGAGNTYATTVPCRYTKQNNFWEFNSNVFKQGTNTSFRYKIEITNLSGKVIQFFPFDTSKNITATVIKTPRIMTETDNPDWDDYVMNQVILQALKLAGIAVSDIQEIQSVSGSGIQSGQ